MTRITAVQADDVARKELQKHAKRKAWSTVEWHTVGTQEGWVVSGRIALGGNLQRFAFLINRDSGQLITQSYEPVVPKF